ncbi:hypothetical protein PV11_01553 [Exophiala sideris]|uniref:Uncharacterized protein n=1 Tax=Exophiala sideris TaxID=1016849 RepID=A0A0D1XDD5_9EURO|nr:hypothetical protein PV11_01553 [Exophiala sideris]
MENDAWYRIYSTRHAHFLWDIHQLWMLSRTSTNNNDFTPHARIDRLIGHEMSFSPFCLIRPLSTHTLVGYIKACLSLLLLPPCSSCSSIRPRNYRPSRTKRYKPTRDPVPDFHTSASTHPMSSPEYIRVTMTARLSMTVPMETYLKTRNRRFRAKFQVPFRPDTPKVHVRTCSFVLNRNKNSVTPVTPTLVQDPPRRSKSYSRRRSSQKDLEQSPGKRRSCSEGRGRGRSRSQHVPDSRDSRSSRSPTPRIISRGLEPARIRVAYDGSQDQGLGGNQTEFGCGSHGPRSW